MLATHAGKVHASGRAPSQLADTKAKPAAVGGDWLWKLCRDQGLVKPQSLQQLHNTWPLLHTKLLNRSAPVSRYQPWRRHLHRHCPHSHRRWLQLQHLAEGRGAGVPVAEGLGAGGRGAGVPVVEGLGARAGGRGAGVPVVEGLGARARAGGRGAGVPVAEGLGARARAGGRGAGVPVAEGLGAWGRGAGCQAAYPVQGPVSHPDPWLVQMSWPWLGQQLVRMPVGPLVVLVVGGGAAQPRAEGRARWGGVVWSGSVCS